MGAVLEQHTGRDNSISRQEFPGRHDGNGSTGELKKEPHGVAQWP